MAALLLPVVLAVGLAPGPLAERHRAFVEDEAHFLLTSDERDRFVALATEELRDRFIEGFWRQWDRDEHRERLGASKRSFGARGPWSERGRALQLLGAPSFRERFTRTGHRLVPVELWHYTGVEVTFLPGTFYLIFYRPGGGGEYRLWHPVADGVAALVPANEPGRLALGAGPELETIDPELALAVEELVPGGGERETLALLASLDAFPELNERHRAFGEDVRVAVSTAELPVQLRASVRADDAGVWELHYALDLAPSRRLAWRVRNGRFRVHFTLVGRLVGVAGERERWEDAVELDVSESEQRALALTTLSFRGRRIVQRGDERFELALVTEGAGAVVAGTIDEARARAFDVQSASEPTRVLMRTRTPAEKSRYRFARGMALARRGASERAIVELEHAVDLGAADVRVHLELARLLYAKGRHRAVVHRLTAAVPRFADEADLWVLMAGSAEALGRFDDAVRYYDRAHELAPGSGIAAARDRVRARIR